MLKRLFFFLMLLLTVTTQARSLVKSHDEYVHLSISEKNQIIIKTMELIVELEERYRHEVRKYGFSQERFDRYTKILSHVKSILFISDATAEESSSVSNEWKNFANQFITEKKGQNICLFAGWISKAKLVNNSKTVCRHPGKATKETGCTDPKKVLCNPAFFGFKKMNPAGRSSMFCVDSADGAHNSAYLCMHEALSTKSNAAQDSRDDRLKFLREHLDQNRHVFAEIQEFIYKTCICDMTDKNFNKKYHEYMRPHRTCLGLMKMLGEVVSCEQTPPLLADTTILKSLADFVQEKNLSESSGEVADQLYSSFLQEKVKESPAEFKRLCGEGGPTLAVSPKEDNNDGDDKPGTSTTPDSLEVMTPPQEKDPLSPSGDNKSAPPNAHDLKNATPMPPVALDPDGDGSTEVEGVDVVARVFNCVKATCVLPKGDSKESTCEYQISEKGKPDAEVSLTEAKIEKEPVKDDKELKVAGKVSDISVDLTCPLEIKDSLDAKEDDKDEELPTLKVKKEKSGDKAFKVKAETSEDLHGWIFSWSIKIPDDSKGLKVEKGWEDKKEKKKEDSKTEKLPGMFKDGSEEEVTKPEEKKKEEEEKPKDKLEIIQKRYDKHYEVCGHLKKEGKKTITECVTIDKLIVPQAMPQQPGQSLRGYSSDTSAAGVK